MVKPDGRLPLLRFHMRMCAMRIDTFMVKYKIKEMCFLKQKSKLKNIKLNYRNIKMNIVT